MNRFVITFICLLIFQGQCFSKHIFQEKAYQNYWCMKNKGVVEYKLPDSSRVDCLTSTYAIEFDFSYKWKEAIGQALYYSIITGKKPGIVLIEEDLVKDPKYTQRLKIVANSYNIKLWVVNPSIFTKFCSSIEYGVCK